MVRGFGLNNPDDGFYVFSFNRLAQSSVFWLGIATFFAH